MRGTNRNRVLLVSSSVILICLTVIVGVTLALFTDTVTVKNHLQAGDLNITLKRTNLVTCSLDATTGYLKGTENGETVDFSGQTNRNIFDINSETRIVPGCYYIATMELSNNAENSDAAYSYWIEMKLDTEGISDEDLAKLKLDEQLKVTVTSRAGTTVKTLSEGLEIGDAETPIGTLSKGTFENFNVKVEFMDNGENDAAKAQSLKFDLIVHAVQATTAPVNP